MANQVMFTALPSGVVSSDAKNGTVVSLSVYVSPQLAGPSLTSTPSFANWPQTVAGLTFTANLGGGVTAVCRPDTRRTGNALDSSLWAAIFGPAALNPWAFNDLRQSGILSYGASAVSSTVKNTYHSVAALQAKPTIAKNGTDVLSQNTAAIQSVLSSGQTIGTNVKAGINPAAASLSGAATAALQKSGTLPATPHAEFARAAAFHNRHNYRGLDPSTAAGNANSVQVDFHQIIGQLADHPAMLRRLGLVIDLEFTVPFRTNGDGSITSLVDGTVNVSLQVSGLGSDVTATHPLTYTYLHAAGSSFPLMFRPYYGDVDPQTGAVLHPLIDTNGLLRLEDLNLLTVDDLDVDHAAIHVSHYADKATSDLNATAPVSGVAQTQVTLPALRTTGLALHHSNREGLVGTRFANNFTWNASGATLVAEDLVRGYRVDVRTVTAGVPGPWKSLCLRQATFTFKNQAYPAITIGGNNDDEGYVKSSAMSAATTDSVYNVNEALFHWDGWSLIAGRPGKVLAIPDLNPPAAPAGTPPPPNLPYSTSILPQAGSLPKLRFGTTYQFRVRAVDLAGNDLLLSAAANALEHASPAQKFSRYEPVIPPNLQLRKAVTEGESVEHLVIRSDPYASPPVYAAAWAAKNTAGSGTAATSTGMNLYFPTCERHIAPPKTSVHMAEYHGAIDAAVAGAANKGAAAWAIVTKEEGTFSDALVTDTTTGQYHTYTQPGRSIVTPPFSQPLVNQAALAGEPTFTGTQDIVPRGSSLQPGQYLIFDTDSVMLPYLPDPNASGAVFQGLGASPTFRTFGARATNVSGGIWPELSTYRLVLQESQGSMTVSGLDPASSPSTPIVVSLPPAAVVSVNYSSTIADPTVHAFCPPATADQANARLGLLPLLAPQRTLTLVHAVQRPQAPQMFNGDVSSLDRNEGETAQTVNAMIRFDGASSGRVELVASWVEYIDQDYPNASFPPPGSVPASMVNPDPSANAIPHKGTIDSLTPDPTDASSFRTVKQLFGDTKRRDITYSTVATTRFREYFPASITADSANITTSAALPVITCKSSARPPTPKVLYTVPSFIFTPGSSGTTTTSKRSGGTVRVYVDRGWFASGADERLGMVLASQPGDANKMPNLVSVWGQDPIWYKGQLGALDTSHLAMNTVAGFYKGFPLAEGGSADIATFTPNFNSARKLWYFDIGLSPDQAYFPFLRLALCRFQPQSIGTLHASPIVHTEFVQLPADRTASVVNNGGGSYTVSLSGLSAPNYPALGSTPTQTASGHTVTAEFQEALTATPDDLDWTTLSSTTLLPAAGAGTTNVTYQGTINSAALNPTSGAKHRILFKEMEVYATDPQQGVRQGVGLVQTQGTQPSVSYTTRVVYADAIALAT